MSYYGVSETKKAGHWLCSKCNTWNNNNTINGCSWCSAAKPNTINETAKGGNPTAVDRELFDRLQSVSKDDIIKISKYIGTDMDLFVYMKTATLAKKTDILNYIKDEL